MGEEMRTCTSCKKELPLEKFGRRANQHGKSKKISLICNICRTEAMLANPPDPGALRIEINSCGETKKELKSRLERQGGNTWKKFVKLREQAKMEGMTAVEAWRHVGSMGMFLPLEKRESHVQREEWEEDKARAEIEQKISEWGGRRTSNLREVALWVFDNMAVSDVKAADAPSPGAWWLLMQAKDKPVMRDAVMRMVEKLMPTKTEVNQLVQYEDDGQGILGMLDRVEKASQLIRDRDVN